MDFSGEVSCLDEKFITFLKCGNKDCKEIAVMSGIGKVEEEYDSPDDPNPNTSCVGCYEIKYMDPPTNIIKISRKDVPLEIRDVAEESFSLFWGHPSSAGNKIRTVLELILDEKGIKTSEISEKGKECSLTLHRRVEEFGKFENGKYKKLSKMLMSIKWLCNAGSHKEELKKEDLLNAYEVLDYVLDEIFVRERELSEAEKTSDKLDKAFNPRNNIVLNNNSSK